MADVFEFQDNKNNAVENKQIYKVVSQSTREENEWYWEAAWKSRSKFNTTVEVHSTYLCEFKRKSNNYPIIYKTTTHDQKAHNCVFECAQIKQSR